MSEGSKVFQVFEGGKEGMQRFARRLLVGTVASLAGTALWATASLAAAPSILYLNFASGPAGTNGPNSFSYNAVNGTGFTGSDTVTLTSPSGKTYTAKVLQDTVSLPGGSTEGGVLTQPLGQIVFQVPVLGMSSASAAVPGDVYREQYKVTVTNANGTSNALIFDATENNPAWSTPDIKPHGNYGTATDFCLSCHMVHIGNDGADVQHLYALLGTDGAVYPTQGTLGAAFGTTNWSGAGLQANGNPNNLVQSTGGGEYGATSQYAGMTNPPNGNNASGQAVQPSNVVVSVCQNCHYVGGETPGLPAGYAGPDMGFNGVQQVATTSHYHVYKNTNVAHPMGGFTAPDSVGVTLAYLNLNTTAYESSGYQGQAPQTSWSSAPSGSYSGLYCGSCHSPHGDMSANAWMGWDAAQFSENYGNNYNANVQNGDGLPDSLATMSGKSFNAGTDYWRTFIEYNGGAGTQPLTNALLIDNPGHQNGIGNSVTNPNVPSSADVLANYNNPNGISMNFAPGIAVANSTYPSGWVDPLFGITAASASNLGATDDTLSNFCMGCHNLNGGAYSGMKGHPAHPLQAYLSPDSAGEQYTSTDAGTGNNIDYDHILNGCTDCHGSPEVEFGSFIGGFNMKPPSPVVGSATYDPTYAADVATFDFPHTVPAPAYQPNDDILLKGIPDGLCLSCHDSGGNSASGTWSSLP